MNEQEQETLIEDATTGWRPRTPDGRIHENPACAGLDAVGREATFEESLVMRAIEAALDPDGFSTAVRALAAAIARK